MYSEYVEQLCFCLQLSQNYEKMEVCAVCHSQLKSACSGFFSMKQMD